MDEKEAAGAPADTRFTAKPVIKTTYKYTMAVSALDCMGCTLCVKACPVTKKALDNAAKQVTEEASGGTMPRLPPRLLPSWRLPSRL